MKIYKYPLEITDIQTLEMPIGAKLLDAQMQNGNLCLWALVDTAANKEKRSIAIYGTGNPMPDEVGEYIATFQTMGGAFVGHVFDLGKPQ